MSDFKGLRARFQDSLRCSPEPEEATARFRTTLSAVSAEDPRAVFRKRLHGETSQDPQNVQRLEYLAEAGDPIMNHDHDDFLDWNGRGRFTVVLDAPDL